MEYIQVREDVLRNRYILEEREWLELSAIDLRITYGEPDSETHKAGFLTFVFPFLFYFRSNFHLM